MSGYDNNNDGDQAGKYRKLFIGNLNYETTEETLKQYFGKWGEIIDCVVMKNPGTKRSRGFGFITYKTAEMVDDSQNNRPHKIDNRELDTKRAIPRGESNESQSSVKKMFIGGLKDDMEEDDIREVFSRFGKIEKLETPKDKHTGKRKAFCFITFEDFDSVDKCVLRQRISVGGKYVEVKKAVAKDVGMSDGRGGFVGANGHDSYNGNGYQWNMGYPGNMEGRCHPGYNGGNHGHPGYNGGSNGHQGYGGWNRVPQGFGDWNQVHQGYGGWSQGHPGYGSWSHDHQGYSGGSHDHQGYGGGSHDHQGYGGGSQGHQGYGGGSQGHQGYGVGSNGNQAYSVANQDYGSETQGHQVYGTGSQGCQDYSSGNSGGNDNSRYPGYINQCPQDYSAGNLDGNGNGGPQGYSSGNQGPQSYGAGNQDSNDSSGPHGGYSSVNTNFGGTGGLSACSGSDFNDVNSGYGYGGGAARGVCFAQKRAEPYGNGYGRGGYR